MHIAVDGIDGSGKDVQARLLTQYLWAQGRKVFETAEPNGATAIGGLLRDMLRWGTCPEAHLPLFLADQLASQESREAALAQGQVVVQVRSFLSTLVYQQDRRHLDDLLQYQRMVRCFPQRVLVLTLSAEEAWARLDARYSRECYESLDGLERYAARYAELVSGGAAVARRLGIDTQIVAIDATGSPPEVHARIVAAVTPWLT